MTSYDTALKISREPQFIKRNFIYKKSFHWLYVLYRVARPFLKVIYKIYKFTHPFTPWTSQASIKIFNRLLTRQMIGFEYGSGNSTVFLAKRLKHLTSVEHQQEWFQLVQGRLKQFGISNVDYHFIPPQETVTTFDDSLFRSVNLGENDFQIRKEYHDYFSFISRYPADHFDFILVDGRARVECALLSISRLKPGGMFVLDNSNRERYSPIFRLLQGWKKINTTTGLFDTTIWFKPDHP